MPSLQTPVLIVGAGPSGMLARLLLHQLGVETVLVERREGVQRAPAAHAVNARTLEICRAAGVDMAAVAAASVDPRDAGRVYWVTKLGGRVLGDLPYERQGDEQLSLTPTPLRNLSQNRFEPILLAALNASGAGEPRWRHQWESAEQTEDAVVSRIRDLDRDEVYEVRSDYLVAADGAGSRVRKWIGIEMDGPQNLQAFIMIHLLGDMRPVAGDPPGILHFVVDGDNGSGVFVLHDLDRESVFMQPFDPERESVADYDKARCREIVRGAIADPSVRFEIETVSTWMMTAQVAQRYRDRRVMIVGDAAHRFPPTGGLGLNTGAQDVHNLAWKLAAVLLDGRPDTLLDTYEIERRPVAKANADQSLTNALQLIEVSVALGQTDDPEQSAARLAETLASRQGLARVREAIARQADHFDQIGLQLGFEYTEGALVAPDTPDEAPRSALRDYVPSGRPGARLPHGWIGGDGGSTLDWVPLDRFLLLTGPEGDDWIAAAGELADWPVVARKVTAKDLVAPDDWFAACGIGATGALLVRPDQHVAWRSAGGSSEPRESLERAFREIFAER
jgi:2,4-dichlorophenol 6-monooxygenase